VLQCISGDFRQIVGHSGGEQVGADKVRRTVIGDGIVVPQDMTVLVVVGVTVRLVVKVVQPVGTKVYAVECAHVVKVVRGCAGLGKVVHKLPRSGCEP